MAYFYAAGSGLPDASVRRRMMDYLAREEAVGPVRAEAEAIEELAPLRGLLAGLIGAAEDEVAFLDWGTLAWNAAVLSLPVYGRRVLVAPGEWSSNIALLQRMGAEIEVMPVDASGALDVAATGARIDDDLAGIFVPQICSLTGERYPVEAIGALPQPADCPYVVDISQSLGQSPVSMAAMGADIVAAPTRKWLRGPKGTGVLAVNRKTLNRMTGSRVADDGTLNWTGTVAQDRGDARRFEKSGFFVPPRLGLLQAVRVHLAEQADIHARLSVLAGHVRTKAQTLGISVASSDSAIVTLRLGRETAKAMASAAKAAGLTVKLATPDCEPMRPAETVSGGFLRISAHIYNNETEIDSLFDTFAQAI